MFCPHCGRNVGDAKYCPSCGHQITAQTNYYDANRQYQYSNDPYFQQQQCYSGKTVHKVIYALIAIFLGDLGLHRFYAGKIFSGVIYLLFCWTIVPGVLGFIEGIVALTRDSDANGNIPVGDGFFV